MKRDLALKFIVGGFFAYFFASGLQVLYSLWYAQTLPRWAELGFIGGVLILLTVSIIYSVNRIEAHIEDGKDISTKELVAVLVFLTLTIGTINTMDSHLFTEPEVELSGGSYVEENETTRVIEVTHPSSEYIEVVRLENGTEEPIRTKNTPLYLVNTDETILVRNKVTGYEQGYRVLEADNKDGVYFAWRCFDKYCKDFESDDQNSGVSAPDAV